MSELNNNTVNMSWHERNLLVLLDPLGKTPKKDWHFVYQPSLLLGGKNSKNTIYVYDRKHIAHYLIHNAVLWATESLNKFMKIFFVQAGLMSVMFHSDVCDCYPDFEKYHLTKKKSLRDRIKRLLPMLVTADIRYIAKDIEVTLPENDVFFGIKVLFYSNESGKLLLTAPDTIINGKGKLAVTTANKDYLPVLEKEFETISKLHTNRGLVPYVFEKISVGSRTIMVEEYLNGVNLRELLRDSVFVSSDSNVLKLLEKVNDWYVEYSSLYNDERTPLAEIYRPILQTFSAIHADDRQLNIIGTKVINCLTVIDANVNGLIPVIAHNDLWPGNFILTERGLVAIDWERAVSGRSELFDYFWMFISAYLEYDAGKTNEQNYSKSFRLWLDNTDCISKYIHEKLRYRLLINGLSEEHFELFLCLFLIEWSMQGQMALGRETDMDRMAFEELKYFLSLCSVVIITDH